MCEAQSPRARIRKEEFDTQLPLNIDDSELEACDLRKDTDQVWTVMTLSNARMECNEKIREIYTAQQRTRQGNLVYIKKTLDIIDDFRRHMEMKYYPIIDDRIPIQHYTRLVIDMHCGRMHAIVLHEYHMSTAHGELPRKDIPTLKFSKHRADYNICSGLEPDRDQFGACDDENR